MIKLRSLRKEDLIYIEDKSGKKKEIIIKMWFPTVILIYT
jgi:hypothetical protein